MNGLPERVAVDYAYLPCPDAFANETVVANAKSIIRNHTPPGYSLDSITASYFQGHNFWRWECTFIRNYSNNETECPLLRAVYMEFRKYCPWESDVHKNISVQLTPNKERFKINYLVNCECGTLGSIKQEKFPILSLLNSMFRPDPGCNNKNEHGYAKQKTLCENPNN